MKKNMMAFLALILALTLCLAPVASADGEAAALKWYYDGPEGEGSADVIKVFNDKLADLLPGTTVEIVFVADYATNWPLLLAGGEQMDLAWNGWSTPMQQDALDGNLLPLDDLVAEYAPNLVEESEIWETAYNSGRLNGQLWAIPSVQPTVPESQALRIYDCMMPYMDVDAMVEEVRNNSKMTTRMLDLVEEAYEAAIADGVLEVGADDWQIHLDYVEQFGKIGYMNFGPEGQRMYYDPEAEDIELYQLYEIPQMKEVLERLGEWYDKGWITETSILKQLPDNVRNTISPSGSWNANWSTADERGVFYSDSGATAADGQGYWTILTNRPEEGYQGVNIFGRENTYMVIPYSAAYPERAMELLNLLHDEVGTPGNDLYNLLCYGFEKNSEEAGAYGWYNYEAVEEDGQLRMVPVEGQTSKHHMENWVIGNTYKVMHDGGSLTTRASKEYCMKFYTEVYPKLKTCPITGMDVDFSNVSLEQEAIKAVQNEYKPQVNAGSGGADKVDALYQEFIDKLYAAGLDKVKAELQSQIDAYVGK